MSTHDARIEVEPADPLATTWNRLALRSGNVFSTYEWASLWRHHFHRDRPYGTVTVRWNGPDPLAIVPLVGSSLGPLQVVRLAGHGLADELGPVCDPADLPRVAPHVLAAVRTFQPDADLFLGDAMPGRIGWDEQARARVLAREASPVLRIAGRTWDQYLADRGRRFRKHVGVLERRVMRLPGAMMRRVEGADELPSALDALFALHRARWGPWSRFARAEAFHRAFAAAALGHGWLRLWLLEIGGQSVAASYGFRFGSVSCVYQYGRDRDWDRYSVGSVLVASTIRAAMEEGAGEFRHLRGDEPYKRRFADDDDTTLMIGLPLSGLGSGGLAAYSRIWRILALGDLARTRIGQVVTRAVPT
jgi:CelD/BcsL family acetyltransferase involved in cellulose biosynthesis